MKRSVPLLELTVGFKIEPIIDRRVPGHIVLGVRIKPHGGYCELTCRNDNDIMPQLDPPDSELPTAYNHPGGRQCLSVYYADRFSEWLQVQKLRVFPGNGTFDLFKTSLGCVFSYIDSGGELRVVERIF